jgi:hypothetical protein
MSICECHLTNKVLYSIIPASSHHLSDVRAFHCVLHDGIILFLEMHYEAYCRK